VRPLLDVCCCFKTLARLKTILIRQHEH
jgi:hypothetical protein